MSGTWHKVEQLRHGIEEVQDLWQEEEQQCFTKVAKDSNHCKCHPGEIVEGVADEYSGWVPGN